MPAISVTIITTNALSTFSFGTVQLYVQSLASLVAIFVRELPPLLVYLRVIGVAHNHPVSVIYQLFHVIIKVDHPERYSHQSGSVNVYAVMAGAVLSVFIIMPGDL